MQKKQIKCDENNNNNKMSNDIRGSKINLFIINDVNNNDDDCKDDDKTESTDNVNNQDETDNIKTKNSKNFDNINEKKKEIITHKIYYPQVKIVKVSCGKSIIAFLSQIGKIYCWHLDNKEDCDKNVPYLLIDNILKNKIIHDVSSGSNHIAFVSKDGDLFTYGNNSHGQLGNNMIDDCEKRCDNCEKRRDNCDHCEGGQNENKHRPLKNHKTYKVYKVNLENNIIKNVYCSNKYTLYLTIDGLLYGFGLINEHFLKSKLNKNKINKTLLNPHLIDTNNIGFKKITIGNDFILGISFNNNIYSWGSNINGSLGHGNFLDYNEPTKIENLKNINFINAGKISLCKTIDGDIYIWGGTYGNKPNIIKNRFDSLHINNNYIIGLCSQKNMWIKNINTSSHGYYINNLKINLISSYDNLIIGVDNFLQTETVVDAKMGSTSNKSSNSLLETNPESVSGDAKEKDDAKDVKEAKEEKDDAKDVKEAKEDKDDAKDAADDAYDPKHSKENGEAHNFKNQKDEDKIQNGEETNQNDIASSNSDNNNNRDDDNRDENNIDENNIDENNRDEDNRDENNRDENNRDDDNRDDDNRDENNRDENNRDENNRDENNRDENNRDENNIDENNITSNNSNICFNEKNYEKISNSISVNQIIESSFSAKGFETNESNNGDLINFSFSEHNERETKESIPPNFNPIRKIQNDSNYIDNINNNYENNYENNYDDKKEIRNIQVSMENENFGNVDNIIYNSRNIVNNNNVEINDDCDMNEELNRYYDEEDDFFSTDFYGLSESDYLDAKNIIIINNNDKNKLNLKSALKKTSTSNIKKTVSFSKYTYDLERNNYEPININVDYDENNVESDNDENNIESDNDENSEYSDDSYQEDKNDQLDESNIMDFETNNINNTCREYLNFPNNQVYNKIENEQLNKIDVYDVNKNNENNLKNYYKEQLDESPIYNTDSILNNSTNIDITFLNNNNVNINKHDTIYNQEKDLNNIHLIKNENIKMEINHEKYCQNNELDMNNTDLSIKDANIETFENTKLSSPYFRDHEIKMNNSQPNMNLSYNDIYENKTNNKNFINNNITDIDTLNKYKDYNINVCTNQNTENAKLNTICTNNEEDEEEEEEEEDDIYIFNTNNFLYSGNTNFDMLKEFIKKIRKKAKYNKKMLNCEKKRKNGKYRLHILLSNDIIFSIKKKIKIRYNISKKNIKKIYLIKSMKNYYQNMILKNQKIENEIKKFPILRTNNKKRINTIDMSNYKKHDHVTNLNTTISQNEQSNLIKNKPSTIINNNVFCKIVTNNKNKTTEVATKNEKNEKNANKLLTSQNILGNPNKLLTSQNILGNPNKLLTSQDILENPNKLLTSQNNLGNGKKSHVLINTKNKSLSSGNNFIQKKKISNLKSEQLFVSSIGVTNFCNKQVEPEIVNINNDDINSRGHIMNNQKIINIKEGENYKENDKDIEISNNFSISTQNGISMLEPTNNYNYMNLSTYKKGNKKDCQISQLSKATHIIYNTENGNLIQKSQIKSPQNGKKCISKTSGRFGKIIFNMNSEKEISNNINEDEQNLNDDSLGNNFIVKDVVCVNDEIVEDTYSTNINGKMLKKKIIKKGSTGLYNINIKKTETGVSNFINKNKETFDLKNIVQNKPSIVTKIDNKKINKKKKDEQELIIYNNPINNELTNVKSKNKMSTKNEISQDSIVLLSKKKKGINSILLNKNKKIKPQKMCITDAYNCNYSEEEKDRSKSVSLLLLKGNETKTKIANETKKRIANETKTKSVNENETKNLKNLKSLKNLKKEIKYMKKYISEENSKQNKTQNIEEVLDEKKKKKKKKKI